MSFLKLVSARIPAIRPTSIAPCTCVASQTRAISSKNRPPLPSRAVDDDAGRPPRVKNRWRNLAPKDQATLRAGQEEKAQRVAKGDSSRFYVRIATHTHVPK
ncbi:hypothetical protein MNV49_005713 [Pseudohyphozyma bogoriensis]|nr:hypothetical protein MNV49_005713 [Pseudohyphozyma bogoriensis]